MLWPPVERLVCQIHFTALWRCEHSWWPRLCGNHSICSKGHVNGASWATKLNVRDEHQSSWSVRSVFINEKWCLSMTIPKKSKILNLYWWFGEKSQIPLDQFIIWFVDLGGKNHRLRRDCLKAASFWCPRFPYLLAAWSFPWLVFFVEKMVQMVIRLSEFIMYFIIFNWGWIELEYVLFPDHERSPWHLDFVFSLILSGFHLTNTWLY